MLAAFLRKYSKKLLALSLSIWFALMAFFCGFILHRERVILQKSIYFLVSSSRHIEASTHIVAWSGGAGYLLENNGCEQVVFSVYLEEVDGLKVQAALTEQETELVSILVDTIYLYRKKDKRQHKKIEGAFETLYNCCTILEKIITRFAQGGTQESGKRLLKVLQDKMKYLSKEYVEIFPQYADFCKKGEENLSKLLKSTVYLKDLRYVLCDFCVAYIHLSNALPFAPNIIKI